MKTLTATRHSTGDTFEVAIMKNRNGIRAEIKGIPVFLDHAQHDGTLVPTVCLTFKEVKEIFGVDVEKPAHLLLNHEWKEIKKEYLDVDTEKAMAAEIVGFEYRMGCDAADRKGFEYDFEPGLMFDAEYARSQKDNKLENALSGVEIADLAKELCCEELPGDGSSYGGYKFNAKQVKVLIKKANAKLAERETEKQERQAEKDQKRQQAFAKAKETGKPIEIESYPVECNDPYEECSCDIISICAMPDGSEKTFRRHTF